MPPNFFFKKLKILVFFQRRGVNPIPYMSGPYVPAACLTVNKKKIKDKTCPKFF